MKIGFVKSAILIISSWSVVASCSQKQLTPSEFEIEPGFTLSLIAKEPLIESPTDLEFNEHGDAMVVTMPGYASSDKPSSIIILQDNNKDGVYDDKIVFTDKLRLATSILPYKNGVIVTDAPYLLFVRDTDNDNKADVIDTLMGGLLTSTLSHRFNGLTYGLDNWIYVANGGNGGKPYWWGDSSTVMDLRGQDFRFNFDKKIMQRIGHTSGGFGLGINTWGHLFETHNLNHLSHLVFPSRYMDSVKLPMNHSLLNISDHEVNGLSRIYPIGEQQTRVNHPEQSGFFSGSCGVTYYEGGEFGPEYEQTVWVADVVLNLIHVDKIKPKGATFVASRLFDKKEFIASTDRSFRPVNMTVGPDGSMYVVDMYRKVIEEPEWIPDEIEKNLDLNAGKGQGRLYKISKDGSNSVAFNTDNFKTVSGQISSLENKNIWVRKTAHRLLMSETLTEENIKALTQLLTATLPFTRVHALWLLAVKEKLTADRLLVALMDQSAGVRENALQIAEPFLNTDTSVLNKCLSLLQDEDQHIRMQAALTISTISKAQFDLHKNEIQDGLIRSIAAPTDEWNLAAITLATKQEPAEMFKRLVDNYVPSNEKLLPNLALVCGNSAANAHVVLQVLDHPKLQPVIKNQIIDQLKEGLNSNISNEILLPDIIKLEKTESVEMIKTLAAMRSQLHLPQSKQFLDFTKGAVHKALDHSLPDSIRYEQLTVLELVPYDMKSEVLFECLKNAEPIKIQSEALRQLSAYDNTDIGKQLVKKWTSLGPQIRRLAGDILLYKKVHNDALLTGLENHTINIGEMNFDLERRRALLRSKDDNIRKRAEALFSDAQVLNRKDAIDKMRPALTLTGTALNGAKIFETVCSHCHVYGAIGQKVGPVLTEINRKSKEELLHDILDPNASVNTEYISHKVETKEGAIHMGVVDSETDNYIVIKKMGGSKVTINKSDIKSLTSMGTSLMPEGFESSMSAQEMADLLTFLQGQK
jgi:putative membrane-bound dehydrogenase-like protein